MAGRNKWTDLQAKRSPQRQQRVARLVHEMKQEMLLSEIRNLVGMTQTELAEESGLRQTNVSRAEQQEDMNVSTLRRIIEGLGGQMEIVAHLPGGDIRVLPFSHTPRTH